MADCTADVWLNGMFLGRHSNSFVEVEYDITHLIAAGENILVVRVDQGLYEVQDKNLGAMRLMWNNEQPYRSYMRKPKYVYGWDWTIWLATFGIWKSVSIRSFDTAWIADVHAYSAAADVHENTAAEVLVDVEIERAGDVDSFIECSIFGDARYDDGGLIARHEGPFSGTAQHLPDHPRGAAVVVKRTGAAVPVFRGGCYSEWQGRNPRCTHAVTTPTTTRSSWRTSPMNPSGPSGGCATTPA